MTNTYRWLRTGDEAFAAMLAAINAARRSVRLETYIFRAGLLGERFRSALVYAAQRGAEVRVLVDAFGSLYLTEEFWEPLRTAGGHVRWFNPLTLARLGFRDHRKLLILDEEVAVVGGFNISEEYEGDGVTRGWRDLGLWLKGPSSQQLAQSFDLLYENADLRGQFFLRWRRSMVHPLSQPELFRAMPFARWRKRLHHRRSRLPDATVLLSGPGRGFSSFKRSLRRDLVRARSAQIISAYFLPTWRIRRELLRLARRGGQVKLLLAGKTDVVVSQLACRGLYQRMLRAGIEIYEYQPQILHAKLIVLDDLVYVGSANFDVRSLGINYELVLRVRHHRLAQEARELFADALTHSRRIDPVAWRASRTFWTKLKERWAHFLLARVDPYFARRQLRRLR